GINGGSPALQLVPRIDVATVPDVQTQYVVHQAQTGTWGMKLNGDIAATDQYMLTALGSNPAPTLSDLSAGISGTTVLTTSWRLTSDELGTPIGIYANPGPITTGLFVTDDFLYTGQALATNLSSDDPNWVNGSLQTQSFDLNQLPSGTYHIWVEANDGRNTPVRRYAPEALIVDHAASWPLTWTAVMTLTPGFREVNVQWQPHPHADADGYVLNVAAPTLSETLVISTGNSTLASVTALDPGRPYSLTLHAVDNETSRVSQSQTVIGVPDGAPFTLIGSTDAINLIAGQGQSLAVTLIAGKEPYPGVVGLQVGCVHQIGADCTLSIGGLTALFAQEIVTPTLAGVAVPVVISSTEQLAAGTYVVPIIASGNGLSRTFEVAVMLQTQNIAVTAPTAATLSQDQVLDLPIATAGINGANRSIGLRVDNIPAGLRWSLDRNTLLPGEDEIVAAAEYLMQHPEIAHGAIRIGFTPDEEVGGGTKYFDVKKFGAYCAYTVDGEELGEVEMETFSADSMTISFEGFNTHPGFAK
ncbi:MAG: hypothetical protein HGB05_22325, partial [Chloroflexi bacterium]|nr:hypothetical protein [Chloroflexota bacterium]